MDEDDYFRAAVHCYCYYKTIFEHDNATYEEYLRTRGEALEDNKKMERLEVIVKEVKKDRPLTSIDDVDGIHNRLKTINAMIRVMNPFPPGENPDLDERKKKLDEGYLVETTDDIKKKSVQKLINENERLKQENEELKRQQESIVYAEKVPEHTTFASARSSSLFNGFTKVTASRNSNIPSSPSDNTGIDRRRSSLRPGITTANNF
ncbi:hypothetical protein [Abyssalbus ytuae]|uniref:Uncharacterized protein n=1 Tax=Abyssalbus ytuae TaxID=2926907 RepID=A0A9E7CU17_9FLAO|nr:hypothetical protein [Abyssalbus ytuae]UOB17382.1 hypothetical protein MQE35_16795 [Abyssalbus ytuae]